MRWEKAVDSALHTTVPGRVVQCTRSVAGDTMHAFCTVSRDIFPIEGTKRNRINHLSPFLTVHMAVYTVVSVAES